MLCEDDENNSEPEIVTHDDVRPEESPEREPDVTSRQSAALEAKADSLADDLSKAALAGKGDGEKVAKRNDVAGAVGAVAAAGAAVGVVAAAGAAVATVSSPKSNRAPSPNVAADDDDDRPQPPDDDSVPDEDSLVIFLNSELALKYGWKQSAYDKIWWWNSNKWFQPSEIWHFKVLLSIHLSPSYEIDF